MRPRGWQDPDRFSRVLLASVLFVVAALVAVHFWNLHVARRSSEAAAQDGLPAAMDAASPAFHGARHPAAPGCLAGTSMIEQPAPVVHRWTDAAGRVSYSDQPPGDGALAHRTLTIDAEPPIMVRVDARDALLSPSLRARAIADAVGVAKVLDDVLGVRADGRATLQVLIAGSDAAFRAASPDGPSQTGIYSGDRRLIVVRAQPRMEDTLEILRHEIVHALLHEWVGRLPSALNEGLAVYFEDYEVRGLGGIVQASRFARTLARAPPRGAGPPELHALLTLPYDAFHAHDRSDNYTRSLGLVSLLMASTEGRSALGDVLRAQRAQPCRPIDAAALLARRWRGGLDALGRAWAAHMRASSLSTQHF
jgi:hypothetical protein